MALNEPSLNSEKEADDIIQNNLYTLLDKLHKEGFSDITINDFEYELLTRCEYLGIQSDKLYPEEDLPGKFGVQRGYNGGGMHSGLCQTEIDRISKNRLAKAERILGYFKNTFWQILKDFDQASENNGATVEA
jgi:hypothetical protein